MSVVGNEDKELKKRCSRNNIILFCIIEALDVIIQDSPTAESVLLRRRVRKDIFCQYLHSKGVFVGGENKLTLVKKIPQLWGSHSP